MLIPRSPNFSLFTNPEPVRGTWHFEDLWTSDPPVRAVILCCPFCGVPSAVWRPKRVEHPFDHRALAGPVPHHSISPSGAVDPSCVCPHTKPGDENKTCGFHQNVILDGWTFGPRE